MSGWRVSIRSAVGIVGVKACFLSRPVPIGSLIITSWKQYVPFLFPNKSVKHFCSSCVVNEYFARNLGVLFLWIGSILVSHLDVQPNVTIDLLKKTRRSTQQNNDKFYWYLRL